jgi:RimJ/RimL family protein N-acetyltransferase
MAAADAATEVGVTTKRLKLVPLCAAHAAALHPLLDDWDVVRMLAVVPWPVTLADVEGFAGSTARLAESTDFAILREGNAIGVCGVKHPGSGAPPRKMPRLGYWLGRPFWQRGYATEAVAAVVGYAFEKFAADRVGAGVFEENPASRRVLEKLGFRPVGSYRTPCLARGEPVATIDMQIEKTTWRRPESRP